MKSAKGKAELLKHRSGKKLSYKQGVLAKCNECCGYYANGKIDCLIPGCPLYHFMPYRATDKKINCKALAIPKNRVSGT